MKTTVGVADPGDGPQRDPIGAHLKPPGVRLLHWLVNPWVSGIAAAASIISVPLAIYLFLTGTRDRALAFYVNPIKTAVVQAGTTSALRVLYKDQPVNANVTAVQIAVWNDGKEPIRAEHVLSEILIRVGSPILEASVKKPTRALTGISLTDSRMQSGIVGLKWRILEEGDGAIIQLIYAGSPDCKIDVEGVVEGQRGITVVKLRPFVRDQPPVTRTKALVMICAYFFAGMIPAVAFWVSDKRFSRRLRAQRSALGLSGKAFDDFTHYSAIALPLAVLAGSGFLVLMFWGPIANPYPPFGF
jgi:hypothetical protein